MRLVGLALILGSCLFADSATAAASPEAARPPREPVRAALEGYARLAGDLYSEAVRGVEELQRAVRAFVASPSRESLERAREAWLASRDSYGRTEAFRFCGGPIDDIHPVTGAQGPEGRINAWPIDEAYLDYVAGAPKAGLISDRSAPVAESTLVSRHAAADETQVTLGFHAIEFLLWGQDRTAGKPGNRPHTDYLPGQLVRERRAACLTLIVDLLLRDLTQVANEWHAGPNRYVNAFLAMPPAEALGRALSGPATLAAFELASERIGIPLYSGLEEDETSCFSDNTHRDFIANIEGIARVLEGDGGVPGLLTALNAAQASDIRARLARVRNLASSVPPPFDAILLSAADDPRRGRLRALAAELLGLCGAIQRAGETAAAPVVVGGGG